MKKLLMGMVLAFIVMPMTVFAVELGPVYDEWIEICWSGKNKSSGDMYYYCSTPCDGSGVGSGSTAEGERTHLGKEYQRNVVSHVQAYHKYSKKIVDATVYYGGRAIEPGLCGGDPARKMNVEFLPLRKKYQCPKNQVAVCKTELGAISSDSKSNSRVAKALAPKGKNNVSKNSEARSLNPKGLEAGKQQEHSQSNKYKSLQEGKREAQERDYRKWKREQAAQRKAWDEEQAREQGRRNQDAIRNAQRVEWETQRKLDNVNRSTTALSAGASALADHSVDWNGGFYVGAVMGGDIDDLKVGMSLLSDGLGIGTYIVQREITNSLRSSVFSYVSLPAEIGYGVEFSMGFPMGRYKSSLFGISAAMDTVGASSSGYNVGMFWIDKSGLEFRLISAVQEYTFQKGKYDTSSSPGESTWDTSAPGADYLTFDYIGFELRWSYF